MRRLALLGIVVTSLALAPTAAAKGPIAGTIDGPGLGGGMTFGGHGEPGGGGALGTLADQGGFFPAVFPRTPDPMLETRPAGNLGPRYTITYRVPGPHGKTDLIRQDLYPYAPNGPVTFTQPKQPIFGNRLTRGGWYQGTPRLKELLLARGLPETAPVSSSGNAEGRDFVSLWPALAIAFALGLVALMAVLVRRRPRTAAT